MHQGSFADCTNTVCWYQNLINYNSNTSFTFPESITYTTSLIVMLVSAILVARIWNKELKGIHIMYSAKQQCKRILIFGLSLSVPVPTIFLTPWGTDLNTLFWSFDCMDECKVYNTYLPNGKQNFKVVKNHLVGSENQCVSLQLLISSFYLQHCKICSWNWQSDSFTWIYPYSCYHQLLLLTSQCHHSQGGRSIQHLQKNFVHHVQDFILM